jgi:hypothetical protein
LNVVLGIGRGCCLQRIVGEGVDASNFSPTGATEE